LGYGERQGRRPVKQTARFQGPKGGGNQFGTRTTGKRKKNRKCARQRKKWNVNEFSPGDDRKNQGQPRTSKKKNNCKSLRRGAGKKLDFKRRSTLGDQTPPLKGRPDLAKRRRGIGSRVGECPQDKG